MKKPTVKKTPAKAKAPSLTPLKEVPQPANPPSATARPTTSAELRAYLGVGYDHVFVGPSGRRFALLAVEGDEAIMQCMDCGTHNRVPLEAIMESKIHEEQSASDESESDLPEIPEGHPLHTLLNLLRKHGATVEVRRIEK